MNRAKSLVKDVRPLPIVVLALNLAGSIACGSYSLFLLAEKRWGSGFGAVRNIVALVYLVVFSVVLPSAELGFMHHASLAKFTRFMLSPMGRAFTFIFMGGVLLGRGLGGWIIGIYLLAVGVFNVITYCGMK